MKKSLVILALVLSMSLLVSCFGDWGNTTTPTTPTTTTTTTPTTTTKPDDVVEQPEPSISVDDIIIDEEDSVEIIVNFTDMIEESVEYVVENPEIAEISGGYLTALSAGETTVTVTSESGVTCTFNVTVNAIERISAIEKFNLMGAFESSLNQLEWVVTDENVAASAALDFRSGANALRLYGGWDDATSTSLDFTVSLTANLGGIEAETHSISYYITQVGTVSVTVMINGEEYTPTWYKKDGNFDRYVVEFTPNAEANVITINIVGTDNPWASMDDLTIVKGVVNDPDIAFGSLTLKTNEIFDLSNLVYTTTPAELPLTELTYSVTGSATIVDNTLVAAAEAGSATLTVTGKVNGVDFTQDIAVSVIEASDTTLEAINEFNEIGTFDNSEKTFTTTGTIGGIILETGTSNYRYEVDNQADASYVVTLETTVTGLEAGDYTLSLVAGAWFHRADIVVKVNGEAIGTFDTYKNTWSNGAPSTSTDLAYDFTVAEGVESVTVTITINVYSWAWGAIDNVAIARK